MNGQWLGGRRIRTNWAVQTAATDETANNTQDQGMCIEGIHK
jgi:hypothetical protein